MSNSSFISSTIGKKFWMSLAALFLASFVVLHCALNFIAILSPDLYNTVSDFMGTNWLVQFIMQPLLVVALVFHFAMGLYLERKNKVARPVKYVQNSGNTLSPWVSRNMALTGIIILAFFVLHFVDFFFPELDRKYIAMEMGADHDYYESLLVAFAPLWRVIAYVVAFVALALHLWHGAFASMQSIGQSNKYSRAFTKLGRILTIVITVGFTITTIVLHFNAL